MYQAQCTCGSMPPGMTMRRRRRSRVPPAMRRKVPGAPSAAITPSFTAISARLDAVRGDYTLAADQEIEHAGTSSSRISSKSCSQPASSPERDDDDARGAVAVRPGVEPRGRMEHVLHAVDHRRASGTLDHVDQAFQAQSFAPQCSARSCRKRLSVTACSGSVRRRQKLVTLSEWAGRFVEPRFISRGSEKQARVDRAVQRGELGRSRIEPAQPLGEGAGIGEIGLGQRRSGRQAPPASPIRDARRAWRRRRRSPRWR